MPVIESVTLYTSTSTVWIKNFKYVLVQIIFCLFFISQWMETDTLESDKMDDLHSMRLEFHLQFNIKRYLYSRMLVLQSIQAHMFLCENLLSCTCIYNRLFVNHGVYSKCIKTYKWRLGQAGKLCYMYMCYRDRLSVESSC